MGRRIKVGDIYTFQLPNGTYAFIRVHRDGAIAVYQKRGDSSEDLPMQEDYEFFVCVYRHVYRNWQFVENRPFVNEDDSWAPPFCWVDQITCEGTLYYRGEQKSCTYEECKDLEILAVWDENHLIDRIMGDSKWQDSFKKPKPKHEKGID